MLSCLTQSLQRKLFHIFTIFPRSRVVFCIYGGSYSTLVKPVVFSLFEKIFLLAEHLTLIVLFLKLFNLIIWFDKRPLSSSTVFTSSADGVFFSPRHFWRLILESLNLFIFLANILQGDVPGLCGPSPGAKLNLPFCNIYSLWSKCKCKFHTVLHSSKISFYCDIYFCREDASGGNRTSSFFTEESGLRSSWPWPSASDYKRGQSIHHLVLCLPVSSLFNISHLLSLFFLSHHASWWKSLLVRKQPWKKVTLNNVQWTV